MYDIEVKNATVHYGDLCVLENINLNVKQNEFLCIIGPNGGGKTTLIKTMMGLIKPTTGEIKIRKGAKLGYVPQFTSFDKTFPIKVIDVVLMGRLVSPLKMFHKYTNKDIEKARYVMNELGILNLENRQIGQLSGGQLQKVLICRALASEPDILFLDEPTANIDISSRGEIYDLLKKINESITLIMITHDMGAISSFVGTVACLNKTLYYHGDNENIGNDIEKAYGCNIDLIAHGHPHRVFREHKGDINND